MLDVEAGQRGYLLTVDAQHLESYEVKLKELKPSLSPCANRCDTLASRKLANFKQKQARITRYTP
jgi:CHASE3 domain sensor protein